MQKNISEKQLREFGLLLGFGFPFLIGWLLPVTAGDGFKTWTIWVGIPGLILALIAPSALYYPYQVWMALGQALGWVNSHLILGLVFLVVLQPIASIMRLTGYDPLRRKRQGKNTYRENRQGHKIDLTRIF